MLTIVLITRTGKRATLDRDGKWHADDPVLLNELTLNHDIARRELTPDMGHPLVAHAWLTAKEIGGTVHLEGASQEGRKGRVY